MARRRACIVLASLLVVVLATSLAVGCKPKEGANFPEKGIEYVCQASAGGSSDRFVRNVVKMLQDQQLITQPITVNNVTGGGGAIAFNYVKGKEGDPYFLLNTSGNFIAASLRDPTVPSYKDFTPICRLGFDLNSIVVRADSPYKTMADLIAAAKANPGKLNWAGTSVASQDHLTLLQLQKVTGTQFNLVSFDGSNEVMAALLGGHVDVATAEPWVAKSQQDAGEIRMLGVVAEQRIEGIDVPTLIEQGYDVFIPMQRGVVAAGNIPAYARDYYIEKFTAMANSQAWKDLLKEEGVVEAFLAGDDYAKFLEEETNKWKALLVEAGVIQG